MAKEKIQKQKPKITEIASITAQQLKTPISVIKGYLEALISGDCGEINSFQKEYLSDALENVKKVTAFVENLLDISRIEAKQFEIQLKPVALEEIVEEVLADFFLWFKASNCEAHFDRPIKLPKVLADPYKIRHVIQNLITNAVTYKRGKGKIEIGLKQVEVGLKQKGKNVVFFC